MQRFARPRNRSTKHAPCERDSGEIRIFNPRSAEPVARHTKTVLRIEHTRRAAFT
jgi:hypothetical protein